MRGGVDDQYGGPHENLAAAAAIRRTGEQLAEDRRRGLQFEAAWGRALRDSPPTIRRAPRSSSPGVGTVYSR